MGTKVIVISYEVYSSYLANKQFMQDEFLAHGYDFRFWSMAGVQITKKKFVHNNKMEENEVLTAFNSIRDMEEAVKIHFDSDTLFIWHAFLNLKTLNLFRRASTISKLTVELRYQYSQYLFFREESNKLGSKLSLFKNPIQLLSLTIAKLKYEYLQSKIDQSKIKVFTPGKLETTDETSVTFQDYYDYTLALSKPRIVKEDYIVFMDNYLSNHPDFISNGHKALDRNYITALNRFFDKVELQTGYKVVISMHPRAKYTDEFGDRLIYQGKTAELVMNCQSVIKHLSSGISYVCLFNKPVVFIYTNTFLEKGTIFNEILRRMRKFADYLESPIINIDNEDYTETKVNAEKNKEFCEKYLLARTFPKSNFEILTESLDRNV